MREEIVTVADIESGSPCLDQFGHQCFIVIVRKETAEPIAQGGLPNGLSGIAVLESE